MQKTIWLAATAMSLAANVALAQDPRVELGILTCNLAEVARRPGERCTLSRNPISRYPVLVQTEEGRGGNLRGQGARHKPNGRQEISRLVGR